MIGYLAEDDDVLTLSVPPAEHVEAGLRTVFLAVPLALSALWLSYLVLAPASGWALLAFAAFGALLVAGLGGYGLARVLRARTLSARSQVRIDRGERLLYRGGKAPAIFRKPSAIVVTKSLLSARLSLRGDDGEETPLLRAGVLRQARLVGDARRLADVLGSRLKAPSVLSPFVALELPRVRQAALYFPLAFVSVPAVLTTLSSSDDPEDRFAARQSAVLYATEGLVLGLLLAFVGLPALALSSHAPALATLGLLCPLGAMWIVRTALRLYGSHRALSGERFRVVLLGALAKPPARDDRRPSRAPRSEARVPRERSAPSERPAASWDPPPRQKALGRPRDGAREVQAPRPRAANATAALGSFDGLIQASSGRPAPLAEENRPTAPEGPSNEGDLPRVGVGGGWWR